MSRMIDADALAKAMGVYTYMKTEWTSATAWGVPIIDAEPVKHGHWEYKPSWKKSEYCECSACHRPTWWISDYCPNCGAKMDEESI